VIERLLIAGHGSIGKRHLRIARGAMPQADIRVLRHQPCAETPEFADGCFDDLTEACAFAPQVAVIANPAPFHLNTALALADAGCHLLVEKPLAHMADGVEALLEMVRTRNLILQVGYNLRFLPSLEEFRTRIRAGTVGRVLSVRCEIGQYLPSWRPDSDYRQGVSARRELGGGALLELSHELDYLRWLFGEVEWVNAVLRQQGGLEIDVEDTAHLVLGFAGASGVAPVIAALNMDFLRHDTTRTCTVIGETGSLRWNAMEGKVEVFEMAGNSWQTLFAHQPGRDDSYLAEWRHFLECIADARAPAVTGHDGLAVLQVTEAARQSSATGAVVPMHQNEMRNDNSRTIK